MKSFITDLGKGVLGAVISGVLILITYDYIKKKQAERAIQEAGEA